MRSGRTSQSEETGALTAMNESMLSSTDERAASVRDVEVGADSGGYSVDEADAAHMTLSDITAPEPIYRRTSPQCAPCGIGRCGASIGAVLVPGLVGLTLVPFVFQHPYLPAPWAIADVTVLLTLVAFLMTAWLHTVFVDPGTTPLEWHEHISRSCDAVRQQYRLCPKTSMYRPPRSHFDSVTRRVVLNMDHFCPWVCNTVGYFNRKFFVLFLFYTVLTTAYAVCSTYFWHNLNFADAEEANSALFFSMILNTTLCVTVSGFGAFHVKMVLTNETTIEPGRGCSGRSAYNVGWRKNWESVMGENPWLWALPIYGSGPSGDGVHWPIDANAAQQRLGEMERSRQIMASSLRAAETREATSTTTMIMRTGSAEAQSSGTATTSPIPTMATVGEDHSHPQYGTLPTSTLQDIAQ